MRARGLIGIFTTLALLPGAAYAAECPTGFDHIFGQIICQFMQTLDQTMQTILTQVYAKITSERIPQALATLFIGIYGIQILMGIAQLTAREAITRMVKLSIVIVVITGTGGIMDLLVLHGFFTDIALGVPTWFLGVLNSGSGGLLKFDANPSDPTSLPTSLYASIDGLFHDFLTGKFKSATGFKLVGFIAALSLANFPLAGPALMWIVEVFLMLVRALVGILTSLATLTFLISLGPIFVCFALFNTTRRLFRGWLNHLISHSLQIILVFACLVLWANLMGMYTDFFTQLNDVIFPNQVLNSTSANHIHPQDSWGFCKLPEHPDTDAATGMPHLCCASGCAPQTPPTGDNLIPVEQILTNPVFMYFFMYYVISLLVLTYGFSALLQSAPHMARQMAGSGGGGPVEGIGMSKIQQQLRYSAQSAGAAADGSGKAVREFTKNAGDLSGTRDGVG